MIISWIHRAWKLLLKVVMILLVTLLIVSAALLALLQLPESRDLITSRLTSAFNESFEGEIHVERLGGFLPFHAELYRVDLFAPGSDPDPVLQVERMMIDLNLWALLRNRITIHALDLQTPRIRLVSDPQEEVYTLERAFRRVDRDRTPAVDSDSLKNHPLDPFRLYAPEITIRQGQVTFEPGDSGSEGGGPAGALAVDAIDASFNIELTEFQQILDIHYFRARSENPLIGELSLQGQIFSDARYLEFNAFHLEAAGSSAEFTGEVSPVRLFSPSFSDQLEDASYRLEISNASLNPRLLLELIPDYPLEQSLEFEMLVAGDLEALHIDRFSGHVGESAVQLTGEFNQPASDDREFSLALSNLVLHTDQLRQLSRHYLDPGDQPGDQELAYLSEGVISGDLAGGPDRFEGAVSVGTPRGQFSLNGSWERGPIPSWQATLELDTLDVSPLWPQLQQSLLDGAVSFTGSGTEPDKMTGEFTLALDEGYIKHISFDTLAASGSWQNRTLDHRLSITGDAGSWHSRGEIAWRDPVWALNLQGELYNIDLNPLVYEHPLPRTDLTLEYNSDLEWSDLSDLTGRINLDVARSIVESDTLRAHQFYADLNPVTPGSSERHLRMTSSFLDADLRGDIDPVNLQRLWNHWSTYLVRQTARELSMDSLRASLPPAPATRVQHPLSEAALDLTVEIKDLGLFQRYLYDEPTLESRSQIQLTLNADEDQLLLEGSLQDPSFRFGEFSSDRLRADVTARFSHSENLRDQSHIGLQLQTEDYRWREWQFSEGSLTAVLHNDSLQITHSTMGAAEEAGLDLELLGTLTPDSLSVDVANFSLGTDRYRWTAEGTPRLHLLADRSLVFEDMIFSSGEEMVDIYGRFSMNPSDVMNYSIRNVHLERISELIGGRIRFAGMVNGDFITQSLSQVPIFEGNLTIRQAEINNRLIGDLELSSVYSPEENRFNTRASVYTDPQRYSDYIEENESIGQNLLFEGYISPPDFDNPDEEFFYFSAALNEIDMWIATLIVPSILEEVEGSSSGRGEIRGSLTDFDFNAIFNIEDVSVEPVFVNTSYSVSGQLEFDRHDGLTFNNMTLLDGQGGRGVLYGNVDLDNFSETTYLNLTLDMNNLQFMNNPFDPDVPFYATARGSGQARITGSNFDPFLRTTQPVTISSGSRISIPILEDTDMRQSQNFIQFVDTFDLEELREREAEESRNGTSDRRNGSEPLTFAERFTLDLQFLANNPVQFQLIFDPVTNEILTANSTGQIRLNLADQNFSLFGRMNITGGSYQFVAGDIISRRFQLLEGGSIMWEGDPANARLDVNATYRSRPDMTSLLTTSSVNRMQGAQRFPIDLVLNIGGTLYELENDFYFQIPSNIEGTLDPTLTTQINALNSNEEEKVIQATSILLSGNFIPLASATTEGGTGSALRESLTGGTVVNPLITSQVINPLLSDQINSLLRGDMALDIDFNLTPYNQVDLGLALRLYDDRLILRRDGTITGPYSDIGDLGATYRINRTFALTAFHRQDPALTGTGTTTEPRQVQEMNGVGLEARFQFNTWRELGRRILNAIGSLFGRKEDQEEIGSLDVYSFE